MTAKLLEERLEGMVMDCLRSSAIESEGEGETGLFWEEAGGLGEGGESVSEEVNWRWRTGSGWRSR